MSVDPYLYDHSNILYDEPCFYYDGGFDLYCLYGDVIPKRGKINKNVTKPKFYPQLDIVNFLFKTCLEFVNDEEINENYKIKKYSFEKKSKIDVRISNINVQSKNFVLISEVFSPKIIRKNISNKKNKFPILNSSPELKLKSYVYSSLKSRKIKFNSIIFKKK